MKIRPKSIVYSIMLQKVNFELIKLTSWFQDNRLSINIKKTKFMLFEPRKKGQTLDHLTVKRCDHTLAQESETVFLGVILHEHLSWKSHIAYLALKFPGLLVLSPRQVFAFTNLL